MKPLNILIAALLTVPLVIQRAAADRAEAITEFSKAPVTFAGVSYQPRSSYRPHDSGPLLGSQTQIHAGFFAPDGGFSNGFVLGVRGGPMVDPHIQIGFAADWEHRSSQQSTVIASSPGPGGTIIITQRQLSSSSEHTFPMLAYLQVSGDPSRALSPYAGIGGGYQVVWLSATDYASNASFDATYGGWAWQAWAGLRVALSGRSGVIGEAYLHQGEAHRDVYDPFYNATFRESVNRDGYGMRFGLSWAM
ncbi:MAG: hypothetical protein HYR73_06435 [Candidatus Eisenbacteria bacterium]|nr:hypothetical protein [Candidatus Eisenbacteria bacterium]